MVLKSLAFSFVKGGWVLGFKYFNQLSKLQTHAAEKLQPTDQTISSEICTASMWGLHVDYKVCQEPVQHAFGLVGEPTLHSGSTNIDLWV